MAFAKILSRDEMKNLIAGGGSCSETLTCPNGYTATCSDSNGECYVEGNGTCHGYLNCGTGRFQVGCWMHDPDCTASDPGVD